MDAISLIIQLKAIDQCSRQIQSVADAANHITKNLGQVSEQASKMQRAFQFVDGLRKKFDDMDASLSRVAMRSGAVAASLGAPALKTLKDFGSFEEAETSLKVSVMQKGGVIDTAQFQKLSVLAEELGDKYKGSTEDFFRMFRVLTEQGLSAEKIINGVGRAVADFGSITGEGYETAALKIAKFQDSLGILDKDMVRFTDIASKAKFAFGLDTQEMYTALPYMSAGLKALGIQGVNASESVMRLIGVLSQAGLPASEVGTSVGQLVNRMADFHSRLGKKSKEMGEIRELLSGTGIDMNFWDKAGNFAGFENMVIQFKKLNALDPQHKLEVMKKLFGDIAGRAVAILGEKGLEGWQAAGKTMEGQASMAERMTLIQNTLAFKWESLTGTIKNFSAAIGDAIQQNGALKAIMDALNNAFGAVRDWVKNNQRLAGTIGVIALSTAGLLAVVGSLAVAATVVVNGLMLMAGAAKGLLMLPMMFSRAAAMARLLWTESLRVLGVQRLMAYMQYHGGFYQAMQYWLMTTRLRMLEVIATTRTWVIAQAAAFRASFLTVSGLKAMALSFGITLKAGIWTAIAAVRAFSIALLTNPIGWIALAIGAVALVIYKYWAPVSGFFRGLWQGLKEGLKGLEPAWNVFKKVGAVLMPILAPLRWIYNLVKSLLKPVDDTGKAAENLGVRWGKAIGGMLKSILLLPYKMYQAGMNMIDNLWKGIKALANKPIEAVKEIAQKIRDLWPFSPAKSGPLKDLHRVRIIETIAESVQSAPLVSRMSEVAQSVIQPMQKGIGRIEQISPIKDISPIGQISPIHAMTQIKDISPIGQISPISPMKDSPMKDKGQQAGSAAPVIHYSPTINISSNSKEDTKEGFKDMLRAHLDELVSMIEKAQYANARRAY